LGGEEGRPGKGGGSNEDNEWSPGASENHNITSINDTDIQKVEDTQFAPTECEEPNTWTPTKYEEEEASISETKHRPKRIAKKYQSFSPDKCESDNISTQENSEEGKLSSSDKFEEGRESTQENSEEGKLSSSDKFEDGRASAQENNEEGKTSILP
jgi:hypothetical protein